MKVHPDTLAAQASLQSLKPAKKNAALTQTPGGTPTTPAGITAPAQGSRTPALKTLADAFIQNSAREPGATTYTRRTRAEVNAAGPGAPSPASRANANTDTAPTRPTPRTPAPEPKNTEPARSELPASNTNTPSAPTPPTPSQPTPRVFGEKDIQGVLARWGSSAGQNNFSSEFDVNNDGQINLADLAHITQNLPPNAPGGTSNQNNN